MLSVDRKNGSILFNELYIIYIRFTCTDDQT